MSNRTHSTDHDKLRDLCAGYALGVLDPLESALFVSHLREGCEECRSEIAEHRHAIAAMGTLLEEKNPPARVEDRLIARLAAKVKENELGSDARPAAVAGGRFRWLSLAASLLALAALWFGVDSRLEVARLENALESFETTTDPVVSICDLEPASTAGGARARATFDPRTSTWRLFAHDLAPAPAGMTYQGWLVTGNTSYNFGTFTPDETGHGFLVMRRSGDPSSTGVRITLEPEGGTARPTGSTLFEYPEPGITRD